MSRYRLAIEAEVPHETISRFINGERGLSLPVLDRIAKVLRFRIVVELEV